MTDQHLSTTALCTEAEVLQMAYGKSDTTSLDYSSSDVTQAISDASKAIYRKYGNSEKSQFYIESDQTEYEFRPDNMETYFIKQLVIHDIDDADSGMSYKASTDYAVDLNVNKLTFTSTQSSDWAGRYCYVDYIPVEWNLLAKNKAALDLLDGDAAMMNAGEGTTDNPRVARLAKKITMLERDMRPFECEGSMENKDYEPRTYDRTYIKQLRFR